VAKFGVMGGYESDRWINWEEWVAKYEGWMA
jgi:hypothetical protein